MERDISLSQHMALAAVKDRVTKLRDQAAEVNRLADEVEASYVPELERELGLAEGDLHDVTKVEIEAKGDVRRILFKSKAERERIALAKRPAVQCDSEHLVHGRCTLPFGHRSRHAGYASGDWDDGDEPAETEATEVATA